MDFITNPAGVPTNSSNIIVSAVATEQTSSSSSSSSSVVSSSSRYENQKRRDWNTFCQYLRNHRPRLAHPVCSGAHVVEFLRYMDQFGKTKVHNQSCPYFGIPNPPAPCACPLRQAWGSLDALIGRLRAAYEEHIYAGGGSGGGLQPPEFAAMNPFGSRGVRLFLSVRDFQSKSRGISYEKKRKRAKARTPQGIAMEMES